jgi:hypothetical protein
MQVPPEIKSIIRRLQYLKSSTLYESHTDSLSECRTTYEAYVKCMRDYKKMHYPFDIASIHGYYTSTNPENQEKISCIIKTKDTKISRSHAFKEYTF